MVKNKRIPIHSSKLGGRRMKDFFKVYGFMLLVIFGFIFFLATTFGVVAASIALCVYFKNGFWALLMISLLFTAPFWTIVYWFIKYGEI